jgi:hypothetical protein
MQKATLHAGANGRIILPMELKEISYEDADRINLAQDRSQW